MRGGSCFAVSVVFLIATAARLPAIQSAERPTESGHRPGPGGLEGWTLNYTIPDIQNERYPQTLVLARRGHVIRRISGDPFVWNWMFWAEGRQVAYEAGPLHFSMQCILVDVATGRQLASYNCFGDQAAGAPEWVKLLQNAQ